MIERALACLCRHACCSSCTDTCVLANEATHHHLQALQQLVVQMMQECITAVYIMCLVRYRTACNALYADIGLLCRSLQMPRSYLSATDRQACGKLFAVASADDRPVYDLAELRMVSS